MIVKDEESGKMFVGGLSWETTEEKLKNYFKKFGDVSEAVVMRNIDTNKPRGFGFVTFKDPDCVTIVLCTGPHELDGRTIDPKACSSKQAIKNRRSMFSPKVFLGGLSSSITESDLRDFFSKYGKVGHIVIMYDHEKKRSKGFGFLAFESEESVARVCSEQFFIIKGKKIECKRAEPREKNMGKNGPGGGVGGMNPASGAGVAANMGGAPGMGGGPQWGGMGWGAPPTGPMPMGGGTGPMAPGAGMAPPGTGYQGNWGNAPQGFPMQGSWGAPQGPGWGPYPGPGGYGPGFQGWGGYGPSWGPGYGQGYGYGNYSYGNFGNPMTPAASPAGPMGAAPQAGNPAMPTPPMGAASAGGPMSAPGGGGVPATVPYPNQNMPPQGKNEFGGVGGGYGGYNSGGGGAYNMPGNQSEAGPVGRGGSTGSQNFHPYRR